MMDFASALFVFFLKIRRARFWSAEIKFWPALHLDKRLQTNVQNNKPLMAEASANAVIPKYLQLIWQRVE